MKIWPESIKAGLKKMVHRIPALYKLYRGIYVVPVEWHQKMLLRHRLRKFGLEILTKIEESFRGLPIGYFANFGTLLGIVRENDFIRYDDDIDIGILPGFHNFPRMIDALLANGFIFKRGFEYDGKITELAFWYKGIAVDFFFNESCEENDDRAGKMWYQEYSTGGYIPGLDDRVAALKCRRIYFPAVSALKKVAFKGLMVNIPENTEEYLTAVYGDNWRTPIKGWTTADSKLDMEVIESPAYVIGLNASRRQP